MLRPRLHSALLAMLMLALLPTTLEAQGLVALLNPGGDRQLAALVPSTGDLHAIGAVIGGVPVSTSSGSEAIDPGGNRFFFVGTPNAGSTKLYSISTINGSVLASPNVSNAQNGILMLDWDAGESKLYCLVSVGAGDRRLCSVNTTSGAVTLLGSPIAGASLSTAGFHALDEAQNRFFFIGTPSGGVESLYIISTATGLELASPDLTGAITSTRSLAWDAAESTLFGLFGLANSDAQLGTVNLATGVVTLRGNPLTGGSISSSGAALDAATDRYYFAGTPSGGNRTVFTVSTVNGLEIESHEVTGAAQDVLALEFDPGPLFADGFDSGNTTLWSATVP